MPTRNINLTQHQDRFVASALAGGRYQNASEVVREALRLLEQRDAEDAVKLERLRAMLGEAEDALARGDHEDVDVAGIDGWLEALDRGLR